MRFAPLLSLCLAFALSACAEDSTGGDVVGPFTGPSHRFVVDRITIPTTNNAAREAGADLNGDGTVDNQIAMVLSTLAGQGTTDPKYAPDLIASGAIASSVEIIADDLINDPTVGVVFHGEDRDSGHPMGGTLSDGVFISNRTATATALGTATFHIPLWTDADPAVFQLDNAQIDLIPDGAGGYNAKLAGTVTNAHAVDAAYAGVPQLFAARPTDHMVFMTLLDQAPRDWQVSEHEFATNSLIQSLLYPDITVHGVDTLSFGIQFHLAPCASGTCVTTPPANRCHDRIVDGDEVGVDCGGSCGTCGTGSTCTQNADCTSNACAVNGVCAAPYCSDGVRDGFETDVDCGSECGATCAAGEQCWSVSDCSPGHACGPSCPQGQYCPSHYDMCR
jgi:hypothetical protein